MQRPNPSSLLAFYETGDSSHLGTFLSDNHAWMYQKAFFLLPKGTPARAELAEDLVSQFFECLLRNKAGSPWQPGGMSLGNWIKTKLCWLAGTHFRKRGNQLSLVTDLERTNHEGNVSAILDLVPDRCSETPESQFSKSELLESARLNLKTLPRETQRIIELVYHSEATYREIAKEVGISPAGISRRVAFVHRMLAKLIDEHDLAA